MTYGRATALNDPRVEWRTKNETRSLGHQVNTTTKWIWAQSLLWGAPQVLVP